ncbi:DHHC palmitoyltransferase-domain-containing protein [Leucosporidium creatinivorum]|uniref:Palmitoyltransferase n=1 Tax=Leucosporidium creatinivorum TaxID=106004 RepID=A0A1Y2G631_9BASI|nr:DHHC palmitoyltransferase-domain-containing protein [Leucosporidium creatinivorum]
MLDCQAEAAANAANNPDAPQGELKRKRPKILGISEHIRIAEAKREQQNGPDSWAVRKFAVGVVIAVYFYSYYVFVVRVCVKMVRMEGDRLGNRSQGIVYLVIYHLLFTLFVWSYTKAILTSPGFARDFVPQSDPPPEEAELVQVEGYRFEHLPPRAHTSREDLVADGIVSGGSQQRQAPVDEEKDEDEELREQEERRAREEVGVEDDFAETRPSAGAFGPAVANIAASGIRPSAHTSAPSTDDAVSATHSTSGTTAVSSPDTFPVSYPPKTHAKRSTSPPLPRQSQESAAPSYLNFPQPPDDYEPVKPRTLVDRVPPRVPVLTEDYRYDSREGFLRPYRSHRCKHCATVVLKMDHHCPWVGTCVGARNYKYFYNFLQSSTLYTLFVFLTLLIANTRPLHLPSRSRPTIDAQQVAIIAIAGFFFLFTGSLFTAHTRLMLLNMTTIEEIGMNRIKSRERSALNRVHGFWGWRAKRQTVAEWNQQWGRLGREGNLWWLGSKRANWEMVMGQRKLGWFVPIPASPTPDDGLSYVPNPRFSKEGYWRERKEWPVELR